jgi:PAS domain S-box-containing protein
MSNKKPTYQDLEKEIIKLKSENEILQSNDRFNMLSKASDDMITVHQPDGKYLYYNGPTCYAISPKEIVGKMPEDIFNKDVSKRIMSAFKKVNKTGESVTIEVLLDWLGEKKWFSEYIYPFKNAKGEVIEIVKVCKDIHQRKIAQQEVENQNIALLGSAKELKASNKAFHELNKELHNSNKKLTSAKEILEKSEINLRTLMNTIPDLIWLKSEDGRYLFVNNRFEDFFGAKEQDIVGKTDYDFVDKELADLFRMNDKKAIYNGISSVNEETVVFANDKHIELLETTKVPVISNDNSIVGVLGIGRDITAERKAEKTLKASNKAYRKLNQELKISNKKLSNAKNTIEKSEINLRTLMNTIPDLIWLKSEDGRYLFVNNRFEDFFGAKEQDIVGKTDYDFVDKEVADFYIEKDKEAISSGVANVSEDYAIFANDNHGELLETTKVPVISKDNSVIGVLGFARNITAKKKAENLTQKLSSIGNWQWNLKTGEAEWSEEMYKIYGQSKETFYPSCKNVMSVILREDLKTFRQNMALLYTDEIFYPFEFRIKRPSGKIRHLLSMSAEKKSEEINFVLIKDITGKKEREKEKENFLLKLEKTKNELNKAQKLGQIGSFQWNLTTDTSEWSEEMYKIYGQSKETFHPSHQNIMSVILRKDLKKVNQNIELLFADGMFSPPLEFRIKRPSGEIRHLTLMSAEKSPENTIYGLIKDITEKKQLEKEKELSELKSKFVSTASHEFRTPLSSINFAAGSIKKYWSKMEPNVIEKKLHKIEDQVMHMTKLLDDILVVGQAEAGKLMYNPIHLNLGDFIYEIIEEVGNSHNKRHKILLIDDEKLKNTSIFIDEKLGRNIFINIISNAVKFSPDADTVTVEFSTEKNYTVISVIDFGIGIPKAELSNIFNPFIRGENVDLIQGTGLGLSIVKEAVDVLGGKIIVNSKIGKGTSFVVKIPKNSK